MKRVQNQVGYQPNEIREETDDRITIVENISVWMKIYAILFGIFILLFQIPFFKNGFSFPFSIIPIIFLLSGGLLILWGIRMFLVGYSVTIDKKSQRIIIKRVFILNLLKSTEEIPFLDIKRIETKRHIDSEDGDIWRVKLIKIQGGSTKIYETYFKSDVEKLAEKLCKIMNREKYLHT